MKTRCGKVCIYLYLGPEKMVNMLVASCLPMGATSLAYIRDKTPPQKREVGPPHICEAGIWSEMAILGGAECGV
jgi:hypothetical protein